jgi:hypothetical protein
MEFVRAESNKISKRRIIEILCFIVPTMLLLGGYVYMIFQYNRLWLFDTIVHENGRYTLWEVILYFRHFLWELPIKTWYAIVITGLFFYYGKPLEKTEKENRAAYIPNKAIIFSGFIMVAFIGIAFTFATEKVGFHEAMNGFLQYRTSELRNPEFGSHWRNHLLSNIVLVSTSAVFILLYRKFTDGYWVKRKYAILFPLGIAVFTVLSIIFGINGDPFTKTSYLGHQIREIFGTDVSITMLLSFGILIHCENKYDLTLNNERSKQKNNLGKFVFSIFIWLVIALTTASYLTIKVLQIDMSKEIAKIGGTHRWTAFDLFAWHFYEHSTDYIYTMAAVAFAYLIALKIELGK